MMEALRNPYRVIALAVTLPLSVQADFLDRQGGAGLEAWFGNRSEQLDELDIGSVGDCMNLDSDDQEKIKSGVIDPVPIDSMVTNWSAEERSCFFDFAQDGQTVAIGSGRGDMHFDEAWQDDEPSLIVVRGKKAFSFERLNNGDPDDPNWVLIYTEEGYRLDFSIEEATVFILRAAYTTIEDSGPTATIFVEHGATLALASRGQGGFRQSITVHPGAPIQESHIELAPGEYTLSAYSVAGVGEEEEFEAKQPGQVTLEYTYELQLAGCDWTGTDGNDNYTGTAEDEVLCALDGDDQIDTGSGVDTVFLGAGNDKVNTASVYDDGITVYGGDGDDVIFGTNDFDELYGEAGHDEIIGGDGDDLIRGGDGDDQIDGGGGDDEIHGEAGFDRIDGGGGDDLILGGDKKDVIHGGDGEDLIAGEDGDDVLYGDDDDDFILGGNGRDTIEGGRGKDDLFGENANDMIDGGIGGDVIEGGQGHDILMGGPNRDRIIGNGGNEILIDGGSGRDRIRSGPGDDYLDIADGEEDFANCGAGNDDASNSDDIVDTLIDCEIVP